MCSSHWINCYTSTDDGKINADWEMGKKRVTDKRWNFRGRWILKDSFPVFKMEEVIQAKEIT